MTSIKTRIIASIVICLIVVNSCLGYYMYRHSSLEAEELFNAEQAQLARVIDSILSRGLMPDSNTSFVAEVPELEESSHSSIGHHYEQKLAFQVWDDEGNLWMMSKNAPLYPLSAQTPGFSSIKYEDAVWHIFALYSNSTDSWIYTAQLADVRDDLVQFITWDYLISTIFMSFVVLLVVVFGVYFGVRPVKVLSSEVLSRNDQHLDSITTVFPPELEPIKQSLNIFMKHIQNALARERSFNADAAHELRTPLAALRVNVQNLELRSEVNDASRTTLNNIILSIDRMSNTVDQLLLLNRIDAYKYYSLDESVDLYVVAADVISSLPAEIIKSYDFELEGESATINGNHSLMSSLVRNLVDNAYKYSPQGSTIRILSKQEGGDSMIEVYDQGPGMTDDQKKNSLERFYRVSDNQSYGTGLGLSIVKRIIELHKGSIWFGDVEGGGLVCRIGFSFQR